MYAATTKEPDIFCSHQMGWVQVQCSAQPFSKESGIYQDVPQQVSRR